MNLANRDIVFFDGYCGLCNGFVDLLLKLDKNNKLLFAPLQGEAAKEILTIPIKAEPDSIVFYQQGKLTERSEAVINILSTLGGIYNIFKLLSIFPTRLLNYFYDIVANNRYKWFGKTDTCRMPTLEERAKILQ